MEGGSATNPYSPPTGDIEYSVPPRPEAYPRALYSPRQMLAGALFGSLFVGVLMLWLNYRTMAKRQAARLALFVGFPIALLWVGMLPSGRVGSAFAMIAALQFYGFCNPIQGPAVFRHYAAGGRRRSNWMVAAFVLMVVVLGALIESWRDIRRLGV